ncbi:MAG: permease [Rhodospirillales bacterium]
MSESLERKSALPWTWVAAAGGLALALAAAVWAPDRTYETLVFVVEGLVQVAPLVIPGILLAAWVAASGAGDRIANAFSGRQLRTVLVASLIGAVTPVCGVTVLPLMAGLLASGVPLAPIMAFWLSSPVTDPAMLATTAATLGFGFALGKTLAAFGLGLFGGLVTVALSKRAWTQTPLRSNRLVGALSQQGCCGSGAFEPAVWRTSEGRRIFRRDSLAITRLILICLIPAFAAEHLLNALLQPDALSTYVGSDSWWAVPLAVFVGAPAYLDGYAALPLTRGLMDHGMSPGAAMAFLVSGGVVSIWGAMAIFPVLKLKPFLLYLALAVTGSLAAGWAYGFVA